MASAAAPPRADDPPEAFLIDWDTLFKEGQINNEVDRDRSDDWKRNTVKRRATAVIQKLSDLALLTSSSAVNSSAQLVADIDSIGLSEGGCPEYYCLVLTSRPLRPVTVEVAYTGLTSNINIVPTMLVFDKGDWDRPQRIRVCATSDLVKEGGETVTITHRVHSVDCRGLSSYRELGAQAAGLPEIRVSVAERDATFAWTMGEGDAGVLGHGDLLQRDLPTTIQTINAGLDARGQAGSLKDVQAGTAHTAVVSEDGCVYIWGTGTEGQLGLGKSSTLECVPRKLTSPNSQDIIGVGCGNAHTIFVTKEGAVFGFGSNAEGQLGLGDQFMNHFFEPVLIGLLSHELVVQVACGGRHTLALTRDGEIYSWGCNRGGQLGHGHGMVQTSNLKSPQKVGLPKGQRAGQVAAGENHSAFVTESALLYTWGWGEDGRLGHGDTLVRDVPTRVKKCGPVCQIGCGGAHSAAIIAGGHISTWGQGKFGQLGHGDRGQSCKPRRVKLLHGKGVCALDLGSWHTGCVTHDGVLYMFGFADSGQLGMGELSDPMGLAADHHTSFQAAATSVPHINQALMGTNVTAVACGRVHSVVLTGTQRELSGQSAVDEDDANTLFNHRKTVLSGMKDRQAAILQKAQSKRRQERAVAISLQKTAYERHQDKLRKEGLLDVKVPRKGKRGSASSTATPNAQMVHMRRLSSLKQSGSGRSWSTSKQSSSKRNSSPDDTPPKLASCLQTSMTLSHRRMSGSRIASPPPMKPIVEKIERGIVVTVAPPSKDERRRDFKRANACATSGCKEVPGLEKELRSLFKDVLGRLRPASAQNRKQQHDQKRPPERRQPGHTRGLLPPASTTAAADFQQMFPSPQRPSTAPTKTGRRSPRKVPVAGVASPVPTFPNNTGYKTFGSHCKAAEEDTGSVSEPTDWSEPMRSRPNSPQSPNTLSQLVARESLHSED